MRMHALILTLSISGFSMHKILVDPSSSTEFLQMFAYKQMGHSLVTLESTGRILIKFNGATTVSLGNMVLLVEVEPVTLNVKFSMVVDLSLYNVIIGRA